MTSVIQVNVIIFLKIFYKMKLILVNKIFNICINYIISYMRIVSNIYL